MYIHIHVYIYLTHIFISDFMKDLIPLITLEKDNPKQNFPGDSTTPLRMTWWTFSRLPFCNGDGRTANKSNV